jgi:hypothetical protein
MGKNMDLVLVNNAYFEWSKIYLILSFLCNLEFKEFSFEILHVYRINYRPHLDIFPDLFEACEYDF